jgi:pimeloyl-ACP methyl ester carboxylesterase
MATFCLLHGAWHEPSCWERVTEQLAGLGHSAIAPDLPLHDPGAGYEDRVRPALEALDGVGEPVVVVAHSQSSALGPLVAAARPVGLLVYLCPRMATFDPPPDGPGPFREGFPFPPDQADGTKVWDPEAAVDAMYVRLPRDDARALAQRLRPMAMPPDNYPLADHPELPTALVYSAEDEFFNPGFERFMARERLGIEPIEIAGGHFPMVEDPGALAALLDRLAP